MLRKILNAIVEVEAIPPALKSGSIIPIYKGNSKDPLNADSYRGITITSVIAKVLEFLILEKMECIFLESGIPHINQTAYRKIVGCADAIFLTQEVIARYVRYGSTVHIMCLYDLQKAFNNVESPVLLHRLHSVGVNGKLWRIIRNGYQGGVCSVKLDDSYSDIFPILRGVRQGSILSPALFLLVMYPLLKQLKASGVGLCVNSYYTGCFLHADDITIATSVQSLGFQTHEVSKFTTENFLQLNPSKCEIISFSRQVAVSQLDLNIDGMSIQSSETAKYLGYIWKGSFSSKPMIESNISKARKAFFSYGSIGAFQGDLSPLSCRSLVETCICPILFYGCENCFLDDAVLNILYSLLGELSKRILRLSKWYSNTAAMVVLDCGSARARCLDRKLCFLHRITTDLDTATDRLSSHMFCALSDDIKSTCLVRECLDIEDYFELKLTRPILAGVCALDDDPKPVSSLSPRDLKKIIFSRDKALLLEKYAANDDTKLISEIAQVIS